MTFKSSAPLIRAMFLELIRPSSGHKTPKQKKLIYAKRIPGRELCSNYSTSGNDQENTRELSLKREQMFPDELDLLLKTVRS